MHTYAEAIFTVLWSLIHALVLIHVRRYIHVLGALCSLIYVLVGVFLYSGHLGMQHIHVTHRTAPPPELGGLTSLEPFFGFLACTVRTYVSARRLTLDDREFVSTTRLGRGAILISPVLGGPERKASPVCHHREQGRTSDG